MNTEYKQQYISFREETEDWYWREGDFVDKSLKKVKAKIDATFKATFKNCYAIKLEWGVEEVAVTSAAGGNEYWTKGKRRGKTRVSNLKAATPENQQILSEVRAIEIEIKERQARRETLLNSLTPWHPPTQEKDYE